MRLAYEDRLFVLGLSVGLPGALIGAVSVWYLPISRYPKLLITALLLLAALGCALFVRRSVLRHILALYSLVEALRGGDYRLRGHSSFRKDELGGLYLSLNTLAEAMQRERMNSEESRRMLVAVLSNIDVAILVFNQAGRLKMGNKAAFELLALPSQEALGRSAAELGIEPLLGQDSSGGVLDFDFPAASGTWRISRERHIEGGQPIQLLFVADVRAVLRAEELKAWKRMTRVLSHEVNNSLAPIASMAGTLQSLLLRAEMPWSVREDVDSALGLIQNRSQHLRSFIRRYAQIAQLPQPNCVLADINPLLRQLPRLAEGARVELELPDRELPLFFDPDQLEQALINLLSNAHEASPDPDSPIRLSCTEERGLCTIRIVDEGQGVANPVNLFVPFYSTKKHGSGIGLVLSRQIAEAHGGSLRLFNRSDRPGCVAELILPKPVYARDQPVAAANAPEHSRPPRASVFIRQENDLDHPGR